VAAAAAGPTNRIVAAPMLTGAPPVVEAKPEPAEAKAKEAEAAAKAKSDMKAVTEAVAALIGRMLPRKSASAQCDP
jgi:hypothetical protein